MSDPLATAQALLAFYRSGGERRRRWRIGFKDRSTIQWKRKADPIPENRLVAVSDKTSADGAKSSIKLYIEEKRIVFVNDRDKVIYLNTAHPWLEMGERLLGRTDITFFDSLTVTVRHITDLGYACIAMKLFLQFGQTIKTLTPFNEVVAYYVFQRTEGSLSEQVKEFQKFLRTSWSIDSNYDIWRSACDGYDAMLRQYHKVRTLLGIEKYDRPFSLRSKLYSMELLEEDDTTIIERDGDSPNFLRKVEMWNVVRLPDHMHSTYGKNMVLAATEFYNHFEQRVSDALGIRIFELNLIHDRTQRSKPRGIKDVYDLNISPTALPKHRIKLKLTNEVNIITGFPRKVVDRIVVGMESPEVTMKTVKTKVLKIFDQQADFIIRHKERRVDDPDHKPFYQFHPYILTRRTDYRDKTEFERVARVSYKLKYHDNPVRWMCATTEPMELILPDCEIMDFSDSTFLQSIWKVTFDGRESVVQFYKTIVFEWLSSIWNPMDIDGKVRWISLYYLNSEVEVAKFEWKRMSETVTELRAPTVLLTEHLVYGMVLMHDILPRKNLHKLVHEMKADATIQKYIQALVGFSVLSDSQKLSCLSRLQTQGDLSYKKMTESLLAASELAASELTDKDIGNALRLYYQMVHNWKLMEPSPFPRMFESVQNWVDDGITFQLTNRPSDGDVVVDLPGSMHGMYPETRVRLFGGTDQIVSKLQNLTSASAPFVVRYERSVDELERPFSAYVSCHVMIHIHVNGSHYETITVGLQRLDVTNETLRKRVATHYNIEPEHVKAPGADHHQPLWRQPS